MGKGPAGAARAVWNGWLAETAGQPDSAAHSHSALQEYKELRQILPIRGMKLMSVCCRSDGALE